MAEDANDKNDNGGAAYSVSSSDNKETAIDIIDNSPSTISTEIVDEKSSSINKKGTKKDGSKDEKEEQDPFAHLPPEEAEILRKQIELPKIRVSYKDLYRYATRKDFMILSVAYVASIISGAALPMFTLVFGTLTQQISSFFTGDGPSPEQFQQTINHNTLYFVYLGIGILVFNSIDTYIHVDRGEVLASRIRQHYLAGVLRQNIAYFDKLGPGEVTTRIINDTNAIQEGISEKAGLIVNGLATFVSALVIGFIKSWRLALVLLSIVVAIAVTMGGASVFIVKYTTKSIEAYGAGSTIAEEALSAIRNTVAFGSQERLVEKFDVHLKKTMHFSTLKARSLTVMIALIWAIIQWTYALAFFAGSVFVVEGQATIGIIITVIMAMIIGAFVLGNIAPSFQAIGTALASGQKIFEAIDRVPCIDSASDEGEIIEDMKGHIHLKASSSFILLDRMSLFWRI
jgi:ATP-binding cassette subfamily B (MDR/TAP) protein 1